MNSTLRARLAAAIAAFRQRPLPVMPTPPVLPAAQDINAAMAAMERLRTEAAAMAKRAEDAKAMLEKVHRVG